jgi:uncharacterized Fe-S cluster-containing radical SAM superfamily protein
VNPRLFLKSARNLRIATATKINRALGREFIPAQRDCLSIETSSICNLNCHFCAYPKKLSPKVVMSNDFFRDSVEQALELGYTAVDLTPCTGDVFMDRKILDKLAWLDENPRVRGYSFHTNFTIPRRQDIDRIIRLKKFTDLHVSVYGHDSESFVAMTQGPRKLYDRLVHNLEYLLSRTRDRSLPVNFAFHTGAKSLARKKSALIDVLRKFARAGASVSVQKRLYNNWGGFVTADDVKHLPITVLGADMINKNGACVRLFNQIQIMATGIVNGCACRDADATLRLGDLHQAPLKDIVSARNPEYMKLIDEQQAGCFRPVCQSCDFYASIYHKSSSYRKDGVELQTLAEFKASLR